MLSGYEGVAADGLRDLVGSVYAEVFAEEPYLEGPDEVRSFISTWTGLVRRDGFRLVVAEQDGRTVGFAFGFPLSPGTSWWDSSVEVLPSRTTTEFPGRTFAVIELAVLASFRRRGVARLLHDQLVTGLQVERLTLFVRPEAEAPCSAYRSWGYQVVGRMQPLSDGPTYDAMVRELSTSR